MLNRTKMRYTILSVAVFIIFVFTPISSTSTTTQIGSLNDPLSINNQLLIAENVQDYADTNTSDVDSSPAIGSHSNFANQQSGPDSSFDILLEANVDPAPTNTEDDIDANTSNVDSTPDQGIEGTFTNAQGTSLDSNYFILQEESVSSGYGGETGSVFVTGSVPDMADRNQFCLYQAIFWNPTDNVYAITRMEFNYTGSQWLNAISQGSGISYPVSNWYLSNKQVAYWSGASPIYVQPHTVSPFYVLGDSNRISSGFYIDIRITANSTTYTESYHSQQSGGNRPGAQLWLGSTKPPTQVHSVAPSVQTTVYVSVEEATNSADIQSGGTLTIDVPTGFTSIQDIGGTGWGTASILGNRITVGNTAVIRYSFLTYAFSITSPSTPGLYRLNIAFDDGVYAHPIGNFTIHVTGTPATIEKLNLEYQWTSATYDVSNEKVCVYVASHTGTEDLQVNYWNGFSWSTLGTISTTGWSNFTATGLTSSTYTIQLIGTSESSDSSKDSWSIDLITLHTWSLQTYNYKLDLEVQWSSTNYTRASEELCIYTGSLATESIRVDVWTGTAWTNIATDLSANAWNNFTVGTWLNSSVFTIRFRGDIETGDTSQSSWEIDCTLLHTWDNNAPQNNGTPSISNIDDGSYMYAEYRQYQIMMDVSDADGYADIDYLDLTLTSNDRLTEYWTIRFDEDANVFSEQSDSNNYIVLDNISSSADKIGNTISATFYIIINWNHPDIIDTDAKCTVLDANPSSDTDYYEVNWDIETRLDLSVGPTLDDGTGTTNRGDVDGSLTASGTVTYLGSSLHPSASDIDIWITSSEYGSHVGPWEATSYEGTGGIFSETVYSDDLVGLDTFTFISVIEEAGYTGTNLFSSSKTAQYIADRVQVQLFSSDDSRVNVNSSASLHVTLYYDYDNSYVTDGSVTVNGISATYSGVNGIWDFSDSKSSAQLVTYNSLVYSGGTHGLSVEDMNGQSLNQIWDNIVVISYSVIDSRVDVDTDATIDVTLVYAYDSSPVTTGTVTINTISATHQGGGVWRITHSESTVRSLEFNLVEASGNTYGISLVDQNTQSTTVTWDRVIVVSYFVADNRVNIGTTVNIDVTLHYEFDSALVTTGTVTINSVLASHIGSGVWRISILKASVQSALYNSIVCSGNAYGITEVNQNSQSQTVIWDQITVRSYSISDDRVNVNDTVNIDVTLEFEYDDTPVISGSVTINGYSASHIGSGVWRLIDSNSSILQVIYDTVTCSGNAYDITSVNQNSQSTSVIWDQIVVQTTLVNDGRVNIGANVEIRVTLWLSYDHTYLGAGDTVTLNGASMSWDAVDSRFELIRSQASVGQWTYFVNSSIESNYGITSLDTNHITVSVIWDQIVVQTTLVDNPRVNVGSSVEVRVILWLAYDHTYLGAGDTVMLNGVSMSWNATDSRFELLRSQTNVGLWTYFVNSSYESAFGISALDLNSQSVNIIWDRIKILTTTVDDSRVSVNDNVELRVTAVLAYDNHPLQSGDTIVMDGVSMTWDAVNGWFDLSRTKASVGLWNFQVDSAAESTYGITVVDLNGQSQNVIWDRLSIDITADMENVENGVQVNFTVTVVFDYDLAECTTYLIRISRNGSHWYSFTYANISQFYDTNSDSQYEYDVSLVDSESTYDIIVFVSNPATIVWGGTNAAPVNEAEPILINPDDSSFMYARLRFYIITSNVSDLQGYGDIDYIELSLWDNARSLEIWKVRYTQSTDTFTIQQGSSYIQLASGSSFVKNGNNLDVIWLIKIDWDHADLSNVDVRQYAVDSSLLSDDNWYEVDWDVETRLNYSTLPSLSDNRGDLNTNDLECTGVVVYYGSSIHPLANETDIWILHDLSGSWSGDVNGLGAFTISSITSSAITRLNTYTIKVVPNGDGSGGSDLYYTTSRTMQFITDRIEFYLSGVEDSRINVNDVGVVWWSIRYEYDNTTITGALTAQLNGFKVLTWNSATSRWEFQEVSPSISLIGYSILSASESTYGITGWIKSAGDVAIIWDQIVVRSYSVIDTRVNVTNTVDIDVVLEYEYDDSYVIDGTVLINSVIASYQGFGTWRISESKSTVIGITYDSVSCFGNLFNITSVNQNSQSQLVIWDRIIVLSYDVIDTHVNVNDTVNIDVSLIYAYDSTDVDSGDVTINGYTASYIGSGVWRITQSRTSIQSVTYNTVACSNNVFGISVVNQNGKSTTIIWDQIIVLSYLVVDDRVNLNTIVNIDVTIEYDFDNTDVETGSVMINGISAIYRGSGVWRISVSESSVTANTYDNVTCSGNTYGISTVNQNSKSVTVIWDQITVRSVIATDYHCNVGTSITISITLEYEYDDADVIDGLVLVNSILFSYTGSNGVWSTSRLRNSVVLEIYNSAVVSGNEYGITSVNQNGQSASVIWDRIRLLTTSTLDSRVNINSYTSIIVTAELEYDGHQLTSGDTILLNGASMNWDAGNSRFYLDVVQSSVGRWRYFVNTTGANEVTYGITLIDTRSLYQYIIWDQLEITITPDASSVNDFEVVTFTISVSYSYDAVTCTSYLVDISRNTTYWRSFNYSNQSLFTDANSAMTYEYTVMDVVSEGTYGITIFVSNTVEVTWSTPLNFAPTNNGAPQLLNPDDILTLYARLRMYSIKSTLLDYDGFSDIDYVDISLWDNSRTLEIWRLRFNTTGHQFSIISGSNYVQIFAASSYIEIGYVLNITWMIKLDWDHPDLQNIDIRQSVADKSSASDIDWYESNWKVETRLAYGTAPYLSDNRGDVGTTDLQAFGNIIYYGSLLSPLANETDVWVIHDFTGSWSGNVNIFGNFTISNIGSSALVRENIYTFKVVVDGAGPASADLLITASPTAVFITDRIEFYLSGAVDSRININTQCDVWWRARYQYDGTNVQSDLEAYLNGAYLLSWDSINSRWHFQESRSSAMRRNYTISSASESKYGISVWITTAPSRYVIWDSLIIIITDPVDQRINVNDNATGINVYAIYSYDLTSFDGTILLNNIIFSYSTPQRQYYTVSSVFGDTYGISAISVNDMTWCIWDQIEVVSIYTDYTYLDPSEYVRVQIYLRYDFDDAPVESGTFSLKYEELTHIGDGVWEVNVTRSSYQPVEFDTLTTCDATIFGITSFNMYGQERTVYWDRLEIFESFTPDGRINVGATGFVMWSIKLQAAGVIISSGIVAEMNDGSSLVYVDGYWRSSHTLETVGDETFTVISATLEGISFFTRSANDVTIIWDRVKVVTTSATSTNPEIETYVQIRATLVYEYDDTSVTDGVVSLWDQDGQITMEYNVTGGFWYANVTKVQEGNYTFYIGAVSGNHYGISSLNLDDHIVVVQFVPALLPRLTPMMIAGITSGFGIIVVISAVLVRKRYLVKVPYEVKQINQALKSMERGEKIEPLDVKDLDTIVFSLLQPGLIELGISLEGIVGTVDVEEIKTDWKGDSESELRDIMEEFHLPDYKRELDEFELDVSLLSESESEEAWSVLLKEVRQKATEEGQKVPITKEDWIERIPSEIKAMFFEEELLELDVSELEQLSQLTPDEVQGIADTISSSEEMYTYKSDAAADAISAALTEKIQLPESEEDEKERLLLRLPSFIKDFFSKTWLEKLTCRDLEELLNIPETELKGIVQSFVESRESQEVKSPDESFTPFEESSVISQSDTASGKEPIDELIVEDLSKLDRDTLIELIPAEVKETIDPEELGKLSKKELISLLESFIEPDEESQEDSQ